MLVRERGRADVESLSEAYGTGPGALEFRHPRPPRLPNKYIRHSIAKQSLE